MAKKPKIYSGRSGRVGRDGDSEYLWRGPGSLARGEKTTVRSGASSSKTYYSGEAKTGLITPDTKVKPLSSLAGSMFPKKPKKSK